MEGEFRSMIEHDQSPIDRCCRSTKKVRGRQKQVVKLASYLKGHKILDVGCGSGDITLELIKVMKVKEAIGIDLTEESIETCKRKGIDARKVDVEKDRLPFEDNYFDVVFCLEVIEHLYDPIHLLMETRKILKSGGFLVISTPNLASIHNRSALLFGNQPFTTGMSHLYRAYEMNYDGKPKGYIDGHRRVSTLKSIKKLLSFCNFNLVHVEGSTFDPLHNEGSKDMLPSSLQPFLCVLKFFDKCASYFPSIAYDIILVAKKEE